MEASLNRPIDPILGEVWGRGEETADEGRESEVEGRAICEGGLPPSADKRGRLLGERRVEGSLEGSKCVECEMMDFWVGILDVEADMLGSEGRRGLSLLVKLFVGEVADGIGIALVGARVPAGRVGEVG